VADRHVGPSSDPVDRFSRKAGPACGGSGLTLRNGISSLAPPACVRWQGVLADLPTTLKVLWTIWLTAMLINVVVWALVSGTSAHLVYPWPLWVADPYGAALLPCRSASRRSGAVVCLPGGACRQ
jgi:hypothetical protein